MIQSSAAVPPLTWRLPMVLQSDAPPQAFDVLNELNRTKFGFENTAKST